MSSNLKVTSVYITLPSTKREIQDMISQKKGEIRNRRMDERKIRNKDGESRNGDNATLAR